MKTKMSAALSVLIAALLVAVAFFLPAPASAEPTGDCRTVAVNLTDRPDTGTGGHVWAKNKMTRTMKVCAEAASGDVAKAKSTWQYSAVVTDEGTFVTNAGKTPRGNDGLLAGVEGTVNGHFLAKFTAESNFADWTPGDLMNTTPTAGSPDNPGWVKTAFPSAEGDLIFDYLWKYQTPCESYVDDNDKYTGDIAGKICVATVEFSNATCKDAKAYIKVTNPNAHVTLAVAFNGVGKTIAKSGSVTHEFTSATVVVEARQYRKVFTYEEPKNCPTESPSPSPSTSSPSPTQSPTTSPTASPTVTATVEPTDPTTTPVAGVGGNDSGGLPLTGDKPLAAFGVGALIVAVGGILFVAARRRRNEDAQAELA